MSYRILKPWSRIISSNDNPSLAILGNKDFTISVVDELTYPTAIAFGSDGRDLSHRVSIDDSDFNPRIAGEYEIKYSVKDQYGNTTEDFITVEVQALPNPIPDEEVGENIVNFSKVEAYLEKPRKVIIRKGFSDTDEFKFLLKKNPSNFSLTDSGYLDFSKNTITDVKLTLYNVDGYYQECSLKNGGLELSKDGFILKHNSINFNKDVWLKSFVSVYVYGDPKGVVIMHSTSRNRILVDYRV